MKRFHLELAVAGSLVCGIIVILAAIANRGFARTTPLPDLLATPTPQPTPTGGWWEAVHTPAAAGHPATPPALPTLPGIGATGLGGAGAGQSAEIAFTVIACPHPTVRIARIMIADRNWWALIGTAEIADFVYYKTELSPDGAGWTLLYRSDTPVADGTLMKFNIRTVPRGTYQLRLVAVDRTGNYPAPCTIQITTR